MQHRLGDLKPCRGYAFGTHGVVRRLLYLDQQAARADSVGHAAADEISLAGLHIKAVQAAEHGGDILPLKYVLPHFARDAGTEAHVYARLLAVYAPTAHDVPAFGFAEGRAEEKLRFLFAGVRLNSQALSGIDELYQHSRGAAELFGLLPAEHLDRAALYQLLERLLRAVDKALSLIREVLAPGVARGHGGYYPILRKLRVADVGQTVYRVDLAAAYIGAPRSRRAELYGRIKACHSLLALAFLIELDVLAGRYMSRVETLESFIIIGIEVDPEVMTVLALADIDAVHGAERDVQQLAAAHVVRLEVYEHVHFILREAEEVLVEHRVVMGLDGIDAVGLDGTEAEARNDALVDRGAADGLFTLVAVTVLLGVAVDLDMRVLSLVLSHQFLVAISHVPAELNNVAVGERLDCCGELGIWDEGRALVENIAVAVGGELGLALYEYEDMVAVAGVDLGKAGFRHHYTHNVAARFRSGVADIELAVSFCPCRYLVRAVCVLEELNGVRGRI